MVVIRKLVEKLREKLQVGTALKSKYDGDIVVFALSIIAAGIYTGVVAGAICFSLGYLAYKVDAKQFEKAMKKRSLPWAKNK